jgi:hypothetical protein
MHLGELSPTISSGRSLQYLQVSCTARILEEGEMTRTVDRVEVLLRSNKFHAWRLARRRFSDETILRSNIMAEKHYTPQELADIGGVSVQTIREVFKNEDGVLRIGSSGTRTRRAYETLRIPESVAERVHSRLSS